MLLIQFHQHQLHAPTKEKKKKEIIIAIISIKKTYTTVVSDNSLAFPVKWVQLKLQPEKHHVKGL